MGLYSNNRTYLSDVDVPALEGYNGNVGIATAMLEATQEDLKFFDMIIARDFQEAEMNVSGYTNEAEMSVITEGALANAWTKIKEFLKKLLAKVKAIFSSIMAKINGTIISDNKKLVEKYKKAVLSKNLKDMKYKWANETGKTFDYMACNKEYSQDLAHIANASTVDAVTAYMEKHEDDMIDAYYSALIGSNIEAGDFAKEAHELFFDEVEEMDEGAESLKTTVMSDLMSCKKELSELEKKQREIEKKIADEIKAADKRASEAAKKVPAKDGSASDADKLELAKANAEYRVHVKYQTVILAANRELINACKFSISQNRAFFTKAAAYNPKAKNESVELFDAIDEAVEFDVESTFADYTLA